MGMRKSDLRYLQGLFKDISTVRMCELGNQVIRSKGIISRISKVYFQSLGVDHVSIDLNGLHDSLQYDLTKPITDPELLNSFDVVTNYGTSEHVHNQYQCFSNMHCLCKKGGLLVSTVPLEGEQRWAGHGEYHYTPAFFHKLAKYCNYKITKENIDRRRLLEITITKEDNPFISEELFNRCGLRKRSYYDKYVTTQRSKSRRTQGLTVRYENRRLWIYSRMQELNITGKNMLCVGARHDSELDFFERRGFETDGIDLYASGRVMLGNMSKMLSNPLLKDRKYDIVFANEVLEHCIDLNGFVEGLNKLCTKYFVCMGPSASGTSEGENLGYWDCAVHKFMTNNTKYPEYLLDTFDQFKSVVSEVHKEGRRLFFILEKK